MQVQHNNSWIDNVNLIVRSSLDLNLPATNVANNRGIVTGKDGVERVGVRTYRPDGSTYYNVPVRPDTNPIVLAQDMNIPFLSGYYQRQAPATSTKS